ncbi:hypothetical protein BDC45DRAFT_541844 [Circinella umbellata]|nr:hypothetical protein BDC45DRAFT_541844 [Circinella umbellata]
MSEIQNANLSVNATTDAVVRADGNFVGCVDLGTFRGRGAGRPARRPRIPVGYQSQFEEISTAGRDVVSDPTSEHQHRHVLPAMSAQCSACDARVWPWERRRRNADDAGLMDMMLINVQEMLEQHNPHVQTFQTAANRLCETPNINLNIRISGD